MELTDFKNKSVLVVGMAKSGVSAGFLLQKLGADVLLYDRKKIEDEHIDRLIAQGAADCREGDPKEAAEKADMLVLSPGVPPKQDFILQAEAEGKEVISEIELGYLTAKAEFVCIGGTNGKTTTTALTGEIFKNGGRNTYVLGNIGVPICDSSLDTREGDVIVAETAALQLEKIKTFHSRAAVICNITEDHMDRFGTMEYYTACKMRQFENMTMRDFAVMNLDDPITAAKSRDIKNARVLLFSRKREVENGAFLREGMIVFRLDGREQEVCRADEVKIPGAHNTENALAAVCLSMCMGIAKDAVAYTLKTFPGVEHRIEFVRTVNGVTFFNDSKGTNPDSTIKAIETMKAPTILILGGYDKHSEFDELFRRFTGNIAGVVLLGATREKLLAAANKAGYQNVFLAESFQDAVDQAYRVCPEGGNVLLSPACASWDMFENFEQRGRVFKEIASKY